MSRNVIVDFFSNPIKTVYDVFMQNYIIEGNKERALEIINEYKKNYSSLREKYKIISKEMDETQNKIKKLNELEEKIEYKINRLTALTTNERNNTESSSSIFKPQGFIGTIAVGIGCTIGAILLYGAIQEHFGKRNFEYEKQLIEILEKRYSDEKERIKDIEETLKKINNEIDEALKILAMIEKSLNEAEGKKTGSTVLHEGKHISISELNSKFEDEQKDNKRLKNDFVELRKIFNLSKKSFDEFMEFLDDASNIFDEADELFERKTELNSTDDIFLATAIGLQLARQYFFTSFPIRLNDKDAAKKEKGNIKEHSDRDHEPYRPSLEQVRKNPVPFDATDGADGNLSGGNHRYVTLGHDPIAGLIFGTMNIATSTLTTASFKSFHIKTNERKVDSFYGEASIFKIIEECYKKMTTQEGRTIMLTSLSKEILHLKSDLNSTLSLPIPFSMIISPKLASKLAEYGIDSANILTVSKQAIFSELINNIISMAHTLLYDGDYESEDYKLYRVKTQKIVLYSGFLSSLVNISYVFGTKDIRKLDVGGIGVAIINYITDIPKIRRLKAKYIFEEYIKTLEKNSKRIEEGYSEIKNKLEENKLEKIELPRKVCLIKERSTCNIFNIFDIFFGF